MSSEAAAAQPPNDPVSVKEQQDAMNANGSIAPDPNSEAVQYAMKLQAKYAEERDKRVADPKQRQYIDLESSDKYRHFSDDVWLTERSEKVLLEDGQRTKFLIIGGGFGGLLFGCRLIDQGVNASDIKMVEVGGGLGGTWYWNRYPGLMCDVESYVYLPVLEEMGYMPKHKYSYGFEIREYLESLAKKYGLADQAQYRTKVNSMDWDDNTKEWIVNMTKARKEGGSITLSVRSQFVMLGTGVLLHPKLPTIPGIEDFKGHSFHTSRWDYKFTGGTPENPELVNLKDKRVGIIGTGATAIQVVPHLAKYAKELVVFQRTPSQVDTRGQRETDPEWWNKEIRGRKGWQKERIANFNAQINDSLSPDDVNMVDDGWTTMRSYRALIGGPGELKMEDIPAYVADLHAKDMPRSERVRARVTEIVKDKETAQSLQSWFPSWCKRPCFHDDYLPTFNNPHVKLVDTDGKGIEALTENGPVVEGKEYPLDVLIWSTGFRAPGGVSPGKMADMAVNGRNGRLLDDKFTKDLGTLHGVVSRDFPNFFMTGPWVSGSISLRAGLTFCSKRQPQPTSHLFWKPSRPTLHISLLQQRNMPTQRSRVRDIVLSRRRQRSRHGACKLR
jgi:cation diffusion facilitator CzcD-associated flavoprotein CzcO